MLQDPRERATISFYKYAQIGNPTLFRDHFYILLDSAEVFGRIYIAYEGVNAQISVPKENLELFRKKLNEIVFLENVRLNHAIEDDGKSFWKLKIKVRPKILADGLNDATFDVTNRGKHLKAAEFNELVADPDTVVIDMRNHYEHEVGHFKNAMLPDVENFRESLPIIENLIADKKDKNILMYCTGGIRCEKASAYYKHRGFKNVHQLDGGIIEYAREVEKQGLENYFIGKNFVFDERMAEAITDDIISVCHQCGGPCDTHVNCANEHCHILFLQCKSCAKENESCCSDLCKDYNHKSEAEKAVLVGTIEFNGTRVGKGRFKDIYNADKLTLEEKLELKQLEVLRRL
jgi:UPF0176 protein